MFPLRDENPTELTPVITFLLLLLNVAAWLLLQGAGTEEALVASVCRYGAIPGEITARCRDTAGSISGTARRARSAG